MSDSSSRIIHENLDTAYVNLAALLRYLQGRGFTGRIHVELDEYEADILLRADEAVRVRERNHATGREEEGEAALQRLMVRAREPSGLITVYEGADATATSEQKKVIAFAAVGVTQDVNGEGVSAEEMERRELLQLSGEVIAAVERAATLAGHDFVAAFRAARTEVADDYTFLDPLTGHFEYVGDGAVNLRVKTGTTLYIAGVSEALRRAVARMGTGAGKADLYQDVARELSILRRRRQTVLERFEFTSQLERIAGVRLL